MMNVGSEITHLAFDMTSCVIFISFFAFGEVLGGRSNNVGRCGPKPTWAGCPTMSM